MVVTACQEQPNDMWCHFLPLALCRGRAPSSLLSLCNDTFNMLAGHRHNAWIFTAPVLPCWSGTLPRSIAMCTPAIVPARNLHSKADKGPCTAWPP